MLERPVLTEMSDQQCLVLIVPSFPQLSETFIVSKFLGLVERGWDIHVVCARSDQSEWKRFPALQQRNLYKRIHITWSTEPKWQAGLQAPIAFVRCAARAPHLTRQYLVLGWRLLQFKIARQFYLDAKLLELQPDLIHFEFGALAVERMYLRKLLNCPITVSFRGYDINYVGLDIPGFYAQVWDKANALHLLGNDLWRRALRRGCPPDKPHRLIPPAIDTTFFDHNRVANSVIHNDVSNQPLRILSVGRLAWKKGYEFALQAVRELVSQGVDCRYTIVGDGDYLGPIAFTRHELELEGIVEFAGPLSREEVRAQMAEADIFLHAAVSEGFCNAVLEAQSMQLPVVCSDADGLMENVVDGVTGFVVPRRNPAALAEKLLLLANDSELRTMMGVAGRERVLTHFQIDDQIEEFDRFYRNVLANVSATQKETNFHVALD